jgi:Uma2 family endonuclease
MKIKNSRSSQDSPSATERASLVSSVRRRAKGDIVSAATSTPTAVASSGDQCIVIRGVSWEQYEAINDAVVDPPNLRMIYCDGRLTLLTESRKHGWFAERLGELVVALAERLGIPWEDAASATYRKKAKKGGVEGDKTFYFAEHAELMRGAQNIDLKTQPPPDLAIEVEATHSADDAVIVWGRLGVPEVWRFDPIDEEFGFWLRRDDGTYERADHGLAFPMLNAADVLEQMKLADRLGAGKWHAGLGAWVRKVILPRQSKGGSKKRRGGR